MLMQWLEPTITKRVQQVSDENSDNKCISEHVDKFLRKMEEIEPFVTEDFYLNVVMELEGIMNLVCFLSEDGAYRKGFTDGLALRTNEKSPL